MNTEPVLPSELWPGILSHFTLWQCYQYITVCKAWANGLVAQSVTTLRYRDMVRLRKVETTILDMPNLTRLQHPFIDVFKTLLVKPDFLDRLQYLDMLYDWPKSNKLVLGLGNLKTLRLCNHASMDYTVLPRLSSLKTLRITSDCECDLLDETLRLLTSLSDLTLSCTTQITDATLGTLTQLHHLQLEDNDLLRGSTLYQLTNLRSLGLRGEKISNFIVPITLTNLTSLDLNHNYVSCSFCVAHLVNLISLSLSGMTGLDSSILTCFPNLTRLILAKDECGDNGLSDVLLSDRLSTMTQLRELRFDSAYTQIVDTKLGWLTNLTSLCVMYATDTTTHSISRLTQLLDLDMRKSDCEGIDISLLPTSLRRLSFKNCTSWTASIGSLSTRLTDLRELWLGVLHLTYERWWPNHLSTLSTLDRLYVKGDVVRGPNHRLKSPATLPRWTELLTY